MAYWAVARLQPHRERLALHCLGLAGFTVYLPRLRSERVSAAHGDVPAALSWLCVRID